MTFQHSPASAPSMVVGDSHETRLKVMVLYAVSRDLRLPVVAKHHGVGTGELARAKEAMLRHGRLYRYGGRLRISGSSALKHLDDAVAAEAYDIAVAGLSTDLVRVDDVGFISGPFNGDDKRWGVRFELRPLEVRDRTGWSHGGWRQQSRWRGIVRSDDPKELGRSARAEIDRYMSRMAEPIIEAAASPLAV